MAESDPRQRRSLFDFVFDSVPCLCCSLLCVVNNVMSGTRDRAIVNARYGGPWQTQRFAALTHGSGHSDREEQLSVMMQEGQWDADIGDDCVQLRSIARVLRSSSIVTELLGEDVQWVRDVRGW